MHENRPLSPHLGIYRWRVNMVQSTLHRLTGLFLVIGALLMVWALTAAATSGRAWDLFATFSASPAGLALWFLWTWALLYHLCNGIHHLVRDAGMNFGPPRRDRTCSPVYWSTGWMVIVLSMALTVLVWIALAVRMTGGTA